MRQDVADREERVASLGAGRACAVFGVGALALGAAVLPALAALGVAPSFDASSAAAAAAGSLAVVWGGVKLAAVAWGLASRFAGRVGLLEAAASVD